jgi:F-type H+-transporting ATPase subunit delta
LENISHIAVPYAKALFDLAVEKDGVEAVYSDMRMLDSICGSNRDFLLMLKSPIVKTEKKLKVMEVLFKSNVSPITYGFLKIITAKRRESFLHDMALAFVELYKDYKGILTTYVKSPVPMSDEVRKGILKVMTDQTKAHIDLVEEIREELIGGFVLQWKDMQYDASILHQLNRLKKGVANINLYKSKIGKER